MCCDNSGPDMSGANQAALDNAALSKESLEFYKQVYAEQAPMRDKAAATAQAVADAQLSSMKQNDAISKDYNDYAKTTFRPLEQSIVTDANNYDTTARREDKAGQAVADIGMQAEIARQANTRQMQRMGVNPNSGKMLAVGNQMALSEAVAKAGAANKARTDVETIGAAKKMDAASLGRNLASNQATSAGISINAGNSAVANSGVPLTQSIQSAGMMGNGFTTAVNANNGAGQIFTSAGQVTNQANKNSFDQMMEVGKQAGQIYAMSDKNKKQDIKPISGEEALAAVEETPVSNWNYKPGMADGGNHTGPMAGDVKKTMGEAVAPGGKKIDLVSMNGISMAAIAALSKKVDKLAKAKGVRA